MPLDARAHQAPATCHQSPAYPYYFHLPWDPNSACSSLILTTPLELLHVALCLEPATASRPKPTHHLSPGKCPKLSSAPKLPGVPQTCLTGLPTAHLSFNPALPAGEKEAERHGRYPTLPDLTNLTRMPPTTLKTPANLKHRKLNSSSPCVIVPHPAQIPASSLCPSGYTLATPREAHDRRQAGCAPALHRHRAPHRLRTNSPTPHLHLTCLHWPPAPPVCIRTHPTAHSSSLSR